MLLLITCFLISMSEFNEDLSFVRELSFGKQNRSLKYYFEIFILLSFMQNFCSTAFILEYFCLHDRFNFWSDSFTLFLDFCVI